MIKIASKSSLDTTISNEELTRARTECNSPYKISIDDFKIIKNLGKGSYAKVVLANSLRTNKKFAIKIIDKNFIEKEEKVDQAHVERQILSRLSHPTIIKLYNTFHNKKKLFYVFEYAEKGDIKEYLNTQGIPNYNTAKFFVAEIVNALEYLHSNGIVHRDLKPENIVIDAKFHLKIIDFATATYLGKYFDLKDKVFKDEDNENTNHSLIGTAEYISPEMISDAKCGYEGDLWALGCILFQLFHNYLPFTGITSHTIMSNIIQNKMNPISNKVPGEVKDLIMKLLVQNPKHRLGANRNFKALKAHPFFRGINFEKIHTLDPPLKSSYFNEARKASFQQKNFIVYNKLNDEEEFEVPNLDLYIEAESEISIDENRKSANKINNSHFVIYEDILKKRSPWFHFNRRKLILFQNRLEYHDPYTNTKKGDIILNKYCAAIIKDEYTFEVFTPNRTFLFKTENKNACNWCEKINSVIEYL